MTAFFLNHPSARKVLQTKVQACVNSLNRLSLSRFSISQFCCRIPSPASSIFFLFPVSMAGLLLTFPSRTRSIRGPATMVLHIRVWESSSMPDFFCPLQTAIIRRLLFFAESSPENRSSEFVSAVGGKTARHCRNAEKISSLNDFHRGRFCAFSSLLIRDRRVSFAP